MDGVKWIKLQTDIFDNDKIIAIENMPEGDSILVIWLKLLATAGKCNNDGMVFLANDIPYTDQLLANRFKKPLPIIQLALNTFERFHMIEIVDDVICVSNWAKYQNIDGLDKVREQNRKRVQAYRDRMRLASNNTESDKKAEENTIRDEGNVTCNVTCNGEVTQSSYSISKSNSNKSIDNTPIVFQLLLNDNSYYEVHQSKIDEFTKLYPNVNIEQAFRSMQGWIMGNPTKRKTRRGIMKFITGWLDREQNKYHPVQKQQQTQPVVNDSNPWKGLMSFDDI